jgi:small subunit ribosomal protein S4
MGRYLGPKLRKRQQYGLAPENASIRRRGLNKARKSDYGQILEEKQKLKFIYGILEHQMRRYAHEALSSGKDAQILVLQKLESRLDNVVYRLGLAKTREQARQFVSHGHILVDAKRLDIPSYSLKPGQNISFSAKMLNNNTFRQAVEKNRQEIEKSSFLLLDSAGGRFLNIPGVQELPKNVDIAKVLEFYHKTL